MSLNHLALTAFLAAAFLATGLAAAFFAAGLALLPAARLAYLAFCEGRTPTEPMERLLADPSLDTTLRGGDKIYVEKDERYFLSLGATGREAQASTTAAH